MQNIKATEIATIKIHVLFFASLKDLFKKEKIELVVKEGSTIKTIRDQLFNNIEGVEKAEKKSQATLYAINHNYASLEDKVKEGDEVAFFPFVSGG
ncbi:MAG: MoaD/ThiS family protein [Candidatus Melainabacteria bacterium]|nr:MoaD/ThiS family protein [Candidatus Melainabacteria bacterium]